jgi:branched-chain amino acid transport system ATP-binding protein
MSAEPSIAAPSAEVGDLGTIAPVPGVPKPDPILIADGVRRRFGGLTAVDVDHVEIQRNQVTALIGPNGAGKTTFFNLLTGFDEPDGGRCVFDGVEVEGVSAHRLAAFGMVRTFQLTKSLARLPVIENMRLGAMRQTGERIWVGPFQWLWRRQEDSITARADELLERFRLAHMRDEFAGNLSGGQRKLLEMARALMTDPKLIMLDEPMAGVNPALKQSLLDHIKQLKGEGRTVLFVEHDMDMVHEISDWVLVMAQGRLIAEGTAKAISGNQDVIDAYLGAHHDVDIGAMDEAQAIEELGLDADELGLDQLEHLGETERETVHETAHETEEPA